MISSFKLRFGRVHGSQAQDVAATSVTVFVGPNNSGKSRVLSELERYCRSGAKDNNALVLDEVTFQGVSSGEAETAIRRIELPPQPQEIAQVGHVFVGSRFGRHHVSRNRLTNALVNPTSDLAIFCQCFLTHKTLILDGRSRINLVNDQGAGDLQSPPQTSFQVLFRDDPKRREVRRIVYEAFGSHLVIDPTSLGNFRIRLSDRAPRDDREERGIHAEAVAFHAAAMPISEGSDGVKAFTGIVTEVIAGDPNVILIDEPEAFLHPSLAAKLGLELSRAALASDKRVFVATHSPAFVMGCIQSGTPVNIVRLTYRSGIATARLLPSTEILELMRHPLLRSTGVLTGLFYEFVIVTESDADRAFYQEINERLLQFRPDWGIPNCLFLNAQNKQTVQTILRPLRQLGIPAVGIVDIDILKNGGSDWTNLLTSVNVPEISRQPLAAARSAVKTAMEASGRDMKRDGGVAILAGSDQEASLNLFDQLAQYGIFVVPGGELESWLRHLGASGHGPSWLVKVFELIGEDPAHEGYVRPTEDDVWKFISRIKTWLVDPDRKGIPR